MSASSKIAHILAQGINNLFVYNKIGHKKDSRLFLQKGRESFPVVPPYLKHMLSLVQLTPDLRHPLLNFYNRLETNHRSVLH